LCIAEVFAPDRMTDAVSKLDADPGAPVTPRFALAACGVLERAQSDRGGIAFVWLAPELPTEVCHPPNSSRYRESQGRSVLACLCASSFEFFIRPPDWRRTADALDLGLIPPSGTLSPMSYSDRHSSHSALTHRHQGRFCSSLATRTVQVRSKEGPLS